LADTVSAREVHLAREIGVAPSLSSPDTLIVERPAGAREGEKSSVFLVTDSGRALRRVPVQYGRASSSWIEILSGLSDGDLIIVSDMRAWDAFERLQLRATPPVRPTSG
jgi:multidrug efflux pump subunit AcrA (membrane-fusion protein)